MQIIINYRNTIMLLIATPTMKLEATGGILCREHFVLYQVLLRTTNSFLGHNLWHISFTPPGQHAFRASAFFGHYLKHRCTHRGVPWIMYTRIYYPWAC